VKHDDSASAPTTLIRGGTVVTASDRRRADVLCREGRIAAVAASLADDF
jgi:dihydroorotase-like cyclic amidohydrolase